MPQRIQLSRAKGWRMPPNTVKVDRGTGYGNPWFVGAPGRVKLHSGHIVQIGPELTAAGAVDRYRRWMCCELGLEIGQYVRHPLFEAVLCPGAPPSASFLRGKNLACWCKLGDPCHADVLLELANASPVDGAPGTNDQSRDEPKNLTQGEGTP